MICTEVDEQVKARNGHSFLHILKTRCMHCGRSPQAQGKCRGWFMTFLELLYYRLGSVVETALVDVVAAVRTDAAGRYWLCKRNAKGKHGGLAGMWEYPGGKVEPGEQLREAMVRELTEEFGPVNPHVGAVLDCITYQQYRVTFFHVMMSDPFVLNNHDEERWFTPRAVCELDHLPSGTMFNARHLTRVAELEAAIREHRDERGHGRCWLDDLRLYRVLNDSVRQSDFTLPPKAEFLRECERFWRDRQPDA